MKRVGGESEGVQEQDRGPPSRGLVHVQPDY